MTKEQLFSPAMTSVFAHEPGTDRNVGDRRDGSVYVYTSKLILAVRVAQATNRPLLIRGGPGNGKSSLARNVARCLGWRYYEAVITSRTQARDLLWEVDLLRRLNDANLTKKTVGEDLTPYIKPGVLWWAFDPASAKRRGQKESLSLPSVSEPEDPNLADSSARAVVLIDEIDKADPDVPNNLLVPLGSLQFQVEETGAVIKTEAAQAPLVFITTNGERELPAAFLRRCIDVEIPSPDVDRLIEIGKAHNLGQSDDSLRKIAETIQQGTQMKQGKQPLQVGVAEFLDAVKACTDLELQPGSADWQQLLELTIFKNRLPQPTA